MHPNVEEAPCPYLYTIIWFITYFEQKMIEKIIENVIYEFKLTQGYHVLK